MSATNGNDKVVIVGAGIGGLALAQSLRQAKVPYEIYERDSAVRSRKQGWAIALVECLGPLVSSIPADLGDIYQTSVNAGVNVPDYLAVLDIDTGANLGSLGAASKDEPGHFLRAGRDAMRNYLWQQSNVVAGKQFSNYIEDDDGVTVFFKDGSKTRGALLIGADGASSHVRTQLLGPSAKAELNPFLPIIGEATLTREQYEPHDAISSAGILMGNTQYRVVTGRRSITPDGESADYFYVVCIRSSDPVHESETFHNATKQELYDRLVAATQDMPTVFQDLVRIGGVEGIVTPPFKLMEVVLQDSMPRGRVTLLGDAAHAMVPFKGAGANTAILDAVDLAKLVINRDENTSWTDLVVKYNAVMVPRGRNVVLESRAAGDMGQATALLDGRVQVPSAVKA